MSSRVRAAAVAVSVAGALAVVGGFLVVTLGREHDAGRSAERSVSTTSPALPVVYHDAVVTGVKDLPDVIGGCPLQPVTAWTDADPMAAATRAAIEYLTTTGQWHSAKVDLAYPVGSTQEGFGSLFAQQIPRWCGPAVADASFGVELTDTSGRWHGTDTHVGVVVAHFVGGWSVWGAFH